MLVTERNFGAAVERIRRCPLLTVDLETTGLRIYQGDRLFGIAVEAAGDTYYFPFRHNRGQNLSESQLGTVLDAVTRGDVVLRGHNFIRFDGPCLSREGERYERAFLRPGGVKMKDTIISALLCNENELSFSLEALGKRYLPGDQAEKEKQQARLLDAIRRHHPRLRAKRQLMGHMADLTPQEVEPYACGDVLDCAALDQVFDESLEAWGLTSLAWEMYDYARLLARIEARGLLIDQDLCRQRVEQCYQAQEETLFHLRARFAGATFNPNSSQQVKALCQTPDAEADTIRHSGHPAAEFIIRYKQLGKMAKTYYANMLDRVDDDGVIHPQMNLSRDPNDRGGTKSGRLSCSNPNFQNLPKRSKEWFMQVRDCVVARPGFNLLAMDYERAEMWLGGHYSNDPSLAEAYATNRDLYQEMAERVDPKNPDRQGGKIDWLAIQYGAGARKLSKMHNWDFRSVDQIVKDVKKPVDEWQNPEWRLYMDQPGVRTRTAFFELCPGVKAMMKELSDRADRVGSMRLWTGRVIHFDHMERLPDGTQRHRPRHLVRTPGFVAWNRLIQGGVGEMVRLSMQRLEGPLDDLGAQMLLQVHDEIVPEAPEGAEAAVAKVCKEIMEDFDFSLRPRTEPMIGKRYGKMEAYNG